MPRIAQHASQATQNVAAFVENLTAAAAGSGGATFDSAAASEFASEALNRSSGSMPETLTALLDDVSGKTIDVGGQSMPHSAVIMRAILDGVNAYTEAHGEAPSADMVEAALYQGYSTTEDARKKFATLDNVSATNTNHDPISMQPNRAVVAIMGSIAEAIPVASYLPYDIGSNEAKLIIVQHAAGSNAGTMKRGDLLDGINAGSPYLSTSRVVKLVAGKAKITATMTDAETCDPAGPKVPLLRGRSIVYVQGLPAGGEIAYTAAPSSMMGGSIRIGSTDHAMSGVVKHDTGEVEATFTPELPANMAVHVEVFLDLEQQPELTPLVAVQALKFPLHAYAWRALTEVSIDSRTQFANEVGITPETEAVLAIRNQFGNERHYQVIRQAERLALWNTGSYNFNWDTFGIEKTRSRIAQDIMAAIYPLEQKMANDTMDHGITHMYVDEVFAATLLCCDSTVFQPSGVSARPSIYRLGRLLNKYEVYVNPRARKLTDKPDESKVLCIGRSTQAGRNPFVLGDAVAPMAVPISTGSDMKNKSGFYARNFTSVNPHAPSAMGCAMLNVTGLTSLPKA
jgi:hypothetical protein